mgnify:CR=1 FL=1
MNIMEEKKPKTYYRNSVEICRQKIRERLQPRLQKLGSITTGIAHQQCHDIIHYSVFTGHFRAIMMEMVEQGLADFVKNGVWFIHKNKLSA